MKSHATYAQIYSVLAGHGARALPQVAIVALIRLEVFLAPGFFTLTHFGFAYIQSGLVSKPRN